MSQMKFEQWVAIFAIVMTLVVMLVGASMGEMDYAKLAFAFSGPVMVVMAGRKMFVLKEHFSKADRLLTIICPFLIFAFAINGTAASTELFGTHQFVFIPIVLAAIATALMIWPPKSWVARDLATMESMEVGDAND